MTENREINVGGITIDIPGDLIDVEDFVQTTLRIAPKALHIVDDVVVKMNWAAGDLKRVGKRLRTYQAVIQIATMAGCKAESKLAYALAQMYLRPDVWDETQHRLIMRTAVLSLTADASLLKPGQTLFAKWEADRLAKAPLDSSC